MSRAILGSYQDVEICALPGYYAAYSGNSLQTFRDNILTLSSGINFSGLEEIHNNYGKAKHTGTKYRGFTVILTLCIGGQPTEFENSLIPLACAEFNDSLPFS